jgi:hypothetical protein
VTPIRSREPPDRARHSRSADRYVAAAPATSRTCGHGLSRDAARVVEPGVSAVGSLPVQPHISRKLTACTDEARRPVEVVSALSDRADLPTASVLADVDEPLIALEEAWLAGLLTILQPAPPWRLSFPEPVMQAAVYGQLGAAQRAEIHLAAAGLVGDELRQRGWSATSERRCPIGISQLMPRDAHQANFARRPGVNSCRAAPDCRGLLLLISTAKLWWLWRTLRDHRPARHSIME